MTKKPYLKQNRNFKTYLTKYKEFSISKVTFKPVGNYSIGDTETIDLPFKKN